MPALRRLELLDELRVQDWEEMIDVNIKGVLYGIAAACEKLRVTIISPGFVQANLADSMTNPEVKAKLPMQWTRWRSRRTRLPALLRSRSNSRSMWMWAR
jgi:NADP-dependent 3-hydroxy acid dehydrogenase YdfG